jgi:DNA primase
MSEPDLRADVDAIKRALSDPRDVCRRLGLDRRARPQGGGGLSIFCPAHQERSPSCSITRGPDGTLRANCFGCGFTGDVFHLLAIVEHLSPDQDFPELLRRAAGLARVSLDRTAPSPRAPSSVPPMPPRRAYPPGAEVGALWSLCRPVVEDAEVRSWLEHRGLVPAAIARHDLARALPVGRDLPRWASFWGDRSARPKPAPWSALGFRLIVPLHDADGVIRSVRARAVTEIAPAAPKALPPSGHASQGLVLANTLAAQMLARGAWPERVERRVVIAEGEPDFLTWATRALAVLGIAGSGQWTEAIAQRIPAGTTAIIRTDQDDAGDLYAEVITRTLWGRCTVLETEPEARRARRATRPARQAEARGQAAAGRGARRTRGS